MIFTLLQIDQGHYTEAVTKGKVDKTHRAVISYTRPYDFMDVSDRQEILEPLFWFGFVQSNVDKFRLT
jgi:hypothetical protein